MAEKFWTAEYLYQSAQEFASAAQEPLSLDHFWKKADIDMAGSAPRDERTLAKRALNYMIFDFAIAKYGVAGDDDVDASIRRKAILEEQLGLPPAPTDTLAPTTPGA